MSARFSNAELSAESYRQMVRAAAESGVVSMPGPNDVIVMPGDAVTFGPKRRETSILADIKRFATLPHFDEVTA